jgi:hypothetical protein
MLVLLRKLISFQSPLLYHLWQSGNRGLKKKVLDMPAWGLSWRSQDIIGNDWCHRLLLLQIQDAGANACSDSGMQESW